MKVVQLTIISCVFAILLPTGSFAQKKQRAFVDTLDNALDVSYYLNNLHGVMPVVAPITEPAVGYGAAVAGLYFLPKKKKNGKKFQMPDVAAVAGGYTQNRTWFAGGGYAGFWKDDHIRYRGVFGYADVKLKYYGIGENELSENPVQFRLKSYLLLQQIIFRIRNSKFLLGGKYQFMNTTAIFFENSQIPGIKPRELKTTNSGIGGIAEYENLNNLFSPSKGLRANITYVQYFEFLGSDGNFGRITAFLHYYQPVIRNHWISGLRFESQLATGDAPFYMKPFLMLRGIPAMRYQGELTSLLETEQEVMITRRWSVVGFGGYGRTATSLDDLTNGTSAWNAGTGFRYLLARVFGLKAGIDVARGPEQWAVYVVVGSSWLR